MRIGSCADQMTVRNARCNDKDTLHVSDSLSVHHQEFKTVHSAKGICQTDTAVCLLAGTKWNSMEFHFVPFFSFIQGVYKRMVRFQKLTRNLFLTLHGQSVHSQQRKLSKFLMRYQQFASHA